MTAIPTIYEMACWNGDENVSKSGSGYKFCCPIHDDENPSAWIGPGDAGGAPKFKCHSQGCKYGEFVKFYRSKGMWPWEREGAKRSQSSKKKTGGVHGGHWDYFDPDAGRVTLRVKRIDYPDGSKDVIPNLMDANGQIIPAYINKEKNPAAKLSNWMPVLYNLVAVRQAAADKRVIFDQEGEGKADVLNQRGFVSSTAQGGSGNFKGWQKAKPEREYKGADFVVVIPDNDRPGFKFALQKLRHLHSQDIRVKFLPLPGLGDITDDGGLDSKDWFAKGHTAEELKQLATEAPFWEPEAEDTSSDEEEFAHVFAGGLPAESNVIKGKFPEPSPGVPLDTEVNNRDRFLAQYGTDVIYIPEEDIWRIYDGSRFEADGSNRIKDLVEDTAKKLPIDLKGKMDPERLERWVKKSLTRAGLMNVVFLSQSKCARKASELDAQPHLLNTPSDTIDLRTLQMVPRSRDLLLSKQTLVDFDPHAECRIWFDFLLRVFENDWDMIKFIQRLGGYYLTGETCESKIAYFFGTGRNGKSTILEFLVWAMGDYARMVNKEMFMKKYQQSSADKILFTRGLRLVRCSEINAGDRLDEGKAKDFSGGEGLGDKALYDRNPQYWENRAKLALQGNHLATVQGQDVAIWERMMLIEFPVYITPQEKQAFIRRHGAEVKDVLRRPENARGVFNFFVVGAHNYYEQGLGIPAKVLASTTTYQDKMDVIGQFIDECCERVEDEWCPANSLWESFKRWFKYSGQKGSWTQTKFGTEMGRKFQKKPSPATDRIHYIGLRLRTHWMSHSSSEETFEDEVSDVS